MNFSSDLGLWTLDLGLPPPAASGQYIEARPGMAALAVDEIGLAESAAVVVAGAAADLAAGLEMLDGDGRRYLAALRHAGTNIMTFGTRDAAGVVRMAKGGKGPP